jgi:hypothetical protein
VEARSCSQQDCCRQLHRAPRRLSAIVVQDRAGAAHLVPAGDAARRMGAEGGTGVQSSRRDPSRPMDCDTLSSSSPNADAGRPVRFDCICERPVQLTPGLGWT